MLRLLFFLAPPLALTFDGGTMEEDEEDEEEEEEEEEEEACEPCKDIRPPPWMPVSGGSVEEEHSADERMPLLSS